MLVGGLQVLVPLSGHPRSGGTRPRAHRLLKSLPRQLYRRREALRGHWAGELWHGVDMQGGECVVHLLRRGAHQLARHAVESARLATLRHEVTRVHHRSSRVHLWCGHTPFTASTRGDINALGRGALCH